MEKKRKIIRTFVLALLVVMACNLPQSLVGSGTAPTDTAAVDSAALTQTAEAGEQATIEAVVAATGAAASPTPFVVATTAAPPPTAEPPPTAAPTLEPTSTTPPAGSVAITKWKYYMFVPLSSGCKFKDLPCWRVDDSYQKHQGANELNMFSQEGVYIDPGWSDPHLVFWHKRDIKSNAEVDVSVNGNGSWLKVRDFPKVRTDWSQEQISLKSFKGQTVWLRFFILGVWGSGGIPNSDWFIQDIRIIPDLSFLEQ